MSAELTIFLQLCLTGMAIACSAYFIVKLWLHWRIRQLERQRDALPAPANPAPQWSAMPGGRLELGATGFYIVLDVSNINPYTLHSPEGRCIAYGGGLPAVKELAERMARDRAEFDAEHVPLPAGVLAFHPTQPGATP